MCSGARSAGSNDRDLDGVLDEVDEVNVETGPCAVTIDAVEQDLPRAKELNALNELNDGELTILPPARDGTLVPPRLALVRTAGFAGHHLGFERSIVFGGNVNPTRVDGNHDRLLPVHEGDGLDGARPVRAIPVRPEPLDRINCLGTDAHFVSSGSEVQSGDFESGVFRAIRIDGVFDPAADGEGDEYFLRCGKNDREHRLVVQWGVAEGSDVQETEFIRSGGCVAGSEGDRFSEVSYGSGGVGRMDGFFADVVLVSLRNDQMSVVIRPYVHTRDDSFSKPVSGHQLSDFPSGIGVVGKLELWLAQPFRQET